LALLGCLTQPFGLGWDVAAPLALSVGAWGGAVVFGRLWSGRQTYLRG
jgi:hypothetical protein